MTLKISSTFDQVVARVSDGIARKIRVDDHDLCIDLHALEVRAVARLTIEAMGLAISKTGEIYDPAPPPAPEWQAPRQQNVRWSGPGRRRR